MSWIAAAPLAAAANLVIAGAGLHADARFSIYEEKWGVEVQAERARARAVRRPVRGGVEALDENACSRYRKHVVVDRATDDVVTIGIALKGKTRPKEIEPILEQNKEALRDLREAARCTRCDWETPWETMFEAAIPNLVRARALVSLGVIEARGLEAKEAVERDLDLVRVGTDFQLDAVLISKMIGIAIEHIALTGLGETLARSDPKHLDLDALGRDLDATVHARPPLASVIRGERLGLRSLAVKAMKQPLQAVSGAPPDRREAVTMIEEGVLELDELYRETEKAYALADRGARDAALDAIVTRGSASSNRITEVVLVNVRGLVEHFDELSGTERLVATAIALEKKRAADGTYPEKLETPEDPATRQPIAYKRSADGKGWELACKRLTVARRSP